jgi:branched-chain amino acid transport system ATP-binding protein
VSTPETTLDTRRSARKRALELIGVTVKYGELTALRDVSLFVDEGEIVTLLGANGAGKTTTLASIVGLIPKARGRVLFQGDDITSLPTEAIVQKGLTLVREGRRIFPELTVAENLRLGAATATRARFSEVSEEMAELFPALRARATSRGALLSGGEQQQLAIARALMSDPTVLLLDEPSLGLAPKIVATVFELVAMLRDRGATILLVEQNVERALQIADRAYILSTGQIASTGAAEALESAAIEDTYLGISRRAVDVG